MTRCGTVPCGQGCTRDHKRQHRFAWLRSRLGGAVSKGLGGGAISAVVLAPCPCCGGLIMACFRGLLSAAIGAVVGLVAYRRKPAHPGANNHGVWPDFASE